MSTESQPHKTCFVTIGATASFASLIKAVLSKDFTNALASHGYTELLIQYGKDGQDLFNSCLEPVTNNSSLRITGFPLDPAGLQTYMLRAKGRVSGQVEGVVISHAGSGTILDALRIAVPLIVVPNEELLDNHQVELAEALAEQGYVIHGKLDGLRKALEEAEKLGAKAKVWPPVNSGTHRTVKGGLKQVIEEEMGFLD